MTVIDDPTRIVATCKRCSGLGEVAVPWTQGLRFGQCPSCNGTGQAVYVRGSGLVPLIPRRQH